MAEGTPAQEREADQLPENAKSQCRRGWTRAISRLPYRAPASRHVADPRWGLRRICFWRTVSLCCLRRCSRLYTALPDVYNPRPSRHLAGPSDSRHPARSLPERMHASCAARSSMHDTMSDDESDAMSLVSGSYAMSSRASSVTTVDWEMRSASPGPSVMSMSSSLRVNAFRHEFGRGLNNYSEVYRLPADEEELERLGELPLFLCGHSLAHSRQISSISCSRRSWESIHHRYLRSSRTPRANQRAV